MIRVSAGKKEGRRGGEKNRVRTGNTNSFFPPINPFISTFLDGCVYQVLPALSL